MTRSMLVAGVAVLLAVAGVKGEDTKKADPKKPFEGKWTIESATAAGKASDDWKGATHSVEGDKFKMTPVKDSKAEAVEGTFTLDPDKKTIDIKPANGRFKDKTLHGIFKIDGDTATVAYAEKDRPKDFESKEDNGVLALVMKRAK